MIQAATDEAAKLRAQLTLANDREDQVTGTLQELQLQYSQVRAWLCSPSAARHGTHPATTAVAYTWETPLRC